MRRLGLPEVRISASKIRHNFAYLQTLGLFFVNGKGRAGGCCGAWMLRGRRGSPQRGGFPVRVRRCCEGAERLEGCGMGDAAMPGGRGLPGAAAGRFSGAGEPEGFRRWALGGAGCGGGASVSLAGFLCEKPRLKPGMWDAACGLRTEGPASARGDSSGGYGSRSGSGSVPGSTGLRPCSRFRGCPRPRAIGSTGLHPVPGSIGPRVLFPGSVPGLGPMLGRSPVWGLATCEWGG